MKDTNRKQEPFVYGSLGGSLIALVPAAAPVAPSVARPILPTQSAIEAVVRDYEFAERIGTRQAWESFLATHVTNPVAKYYVELARAARDKVIATTALYERQHQLHPNPELNRTDEKPQLAAVSPIKPKKAETSALGPPASLESLARNFLNNYLRRSQDNLAELINYARNNYAAEVEYYGEHLKNEQVIEDQRRYATRWPEREFRVRPATASIACNRVASSCEMSGQIDFRAANAAKGKEFSGIATYFLHVIFTPSGPKIVAEDGKVISRR